MRSYCSRKRKEKGLTKFWCSPAPPVSCGYAFKGTRCNLNQAHYLTFHLKIRLKRAAVFLLDLPATDAVCSSFLFAETTSAGDTLGLGRVAVLPPPDQVGFAD